MGDGEESAVPAGKQGIPFTRHDSTFMPKRADFVEAWRDPPLRARVQRVYELSLHTRAMRAIARFVEANGKLLAAGISYMALFSLTAAVTLGGMLFSLLAKTDGAFRTAMITAVNSWLPGLIRSETTPDGLVDLATLGASAGTPIATIIFSAIMLYSASIVVASFSTAIRAMFGLSTVRVRPLTMISQRIIGLAALFLGIVSTAVFTLISARLRAGASQLAPEVDHRVGDAFYAVLTWGASLAIDYALMVVMIRWVAGVRPLRRDLMWGALGGAIATTVLRVLGTSVVTNVDGAILTAATTLITLVVWVNLQARIILLASAWTANPPRVQVRTVRVSRHEGHRPNYATLSDFRSLEIARQEEEEARHGDYYREGDAAAVPDANQGQVKS